MKAEYWCGETLVLSDSGYYPASLRAVGEPIVLDSAYFMITQVTKRGDFVKYQMGKSAQCKKCGGTKGLGLHAGLRGCICRP